MEGVEGLQNGRTIRKSDDMFRFITGRRGFGKIIEGLIFCKLFFGKALCHQRFAGRYFSLFLGLQALTEAGSAAIMRLSWQSL